MIMTRLILDIIQLTFRRRLAIYQNDGCTDREGEEFVDLRPLCFPVGLSVEAQDPT